MGDGDDVVIEASKLGTKEFWDSRYEMELENFRDNGDEGEVWFGRSAENRIVKYLLNTAVNKNCAILDLGCGNGSVLRRLREKSFSNLTGVDYSLAAIELACRTSEEDAKESDTDVDIRFQVFDILEPKPGFLQNQFDIVLDKGTWDAMTLSDERETRRKAYLAVLLSALRDDDSSRFVIFSCNYTKDELCDLFGGQQGLKFDCEIPAQHVISFGGKQGVTSTGVVFKR